MPPVAQSYVCRHTYCPLFDTVCCVPCRAMWCAAVCFRVQQVGQFRAVVSKMAAKHNAEHERSARHRAMQLSRLSQVEALSSSFPFFSPSSPQQQPPLATGADTDADQGQDQAQAPTAEAIREALYEASVVLASSPTTVTISNTTLPGAAGTVAGIRVVPLEVAQRACAFLFNRLAYVGLLM